MANKVARYINNVGKSIAYASIDAIKSRTAASSDFIETNADVFKTIYTSIKDYKATYKKIGVAVKDHKAYAAADEMIKGIKEDIKSGEFYGNKERVDRIQQKAAGALADMSDMDIGDYNFDDDSGFDMSIFDDDGDVDIDVDEDRSKRSTTALANVMANTSEAIIEQSKINTNMIFAQNAQIFNNMNTSLSTINETIGKVTSATEAMLKFNNENTTKFYANTGEQLTSIVNILKDMNERQKKQYGIEDNPKEKAKKLGYDDVVTSEGMPNLKEYGKVIGNNLKKVLGPEYDLLFGNTFGDGSNTLLAFAASPLQFIPKFIANAMIPVTLDRAMKALDKSISSIFSNVIASFNNAAGGENPIMKKIGELFGIRISSSTSLDPKNYKKDAIPFDGITKKAIVDVIPGHLRRIEKLLGGQHERIFDYDTGKWTTDRELKKSYDRMTNTAPIGNAYGDLIKMLDKRFNETILPETLRDRDKLDENLEKFLRQLWKQNGVFRFNDKDGINNFTDIMGGGVDETFMQVVQQIMRDNSNYQTGDKEFRQAIMDLTKNTLSEKASLGKRIKDMDEAGTSAYFNLFNGSVDASDIGYKDKDNIKGLKAPKNFLLTTKDNKGKNLFWYLQMIYSENRRINNNIATLGSAGGFGGSSITSINGQPTSHGLRFDTSDSNILADEVDRSKLRRENEERYTSRVESITAKRGGVVGDVTDPEFRAAAVVQSGIDATKDHMKKNKELQEEIKNSVYEKYVGARADKYKEANESFLAQWKGTKTILGKIEFMKNSLASLANKPAEILTSVLETADKNIYEMLFGIDDPNAVDSKGRPVKGVFGYFKYKVTEMFDGINKFIDEKFLTWFKERGMNNFRDVGDRLLSSVGFTSERRQAMRDKTREVLSPYTDAIRGSFKEALEYSKKSVKETASDAATLYENTFSDNETNAKGARYINKSGLTTISEGEMIIPAEWNPMNPNRDKVNKQKEIGNELDIKNNFLSEFFNIGMNATGTPFIGIRKNNQTGSMNNYENGKLANKIYDKVKNTYQISRGTILQLIEENKAAYPDDSNTAIETKVINDIRTVTKLQKSRDKTANKITIDKDGNRVDTEGNIVDEQGNIVNKPRKENDIIDRFGAGVQKVSKNVAQSAAYTYKRLFSGRTEMSDKGLEAAMNDVTANISEYAPDAVGKGLVGGLGGTLLLGPVIGPIVGASLGVGMSLSKNSEKVQQWLFGTEDLDDGMISKDFQEKFNKYMPDMGKYGITGAIASLVLPFGPVAGLMIGAGAGFAKNNKDVQDMLFGNEELGTDGLMKRETLDKIKKAFPSLAVGGLAGMLLGPFGLIGNTLLGASAGFVSSTDGFKDAVYGKVNPETGEREGGVIGALHEGLVVPLKEGVKGFGKDLLLFLKKDIISPLKNFIKPFSDMMVNTFENLGRGIKNSIDSFLEKTIGLPLERLIKERLLEPLLGIGKGLFKAAMAPAKFVASSPFRMLGGIGTMMRGSQIRRGTARGLSAQEQLDYAAEKGTSLKYGQKTALETIAGMGIETENGIAGLEDMKNLANQVFRGKKHFRDERISTTRDMTSDLIGYLDGQGIDKKKLSYKKRNNLIQIAKKGVPNEEFLKKAIAETGLDTIDQDKIYEKLSKYNNTFKRINTDEETYNPQNQEQLDKLQELFPQFNLKKGGKDLHKLKRFLNNEYQARRKSTLAGETSDETSTEDNPIKEDTTVLVERVSAIQSILENLVEIGKDITNPDRIKSLEGEMSKASKLSEDAEERVANVRKGAQTTRKNKDRKRTAKATVKQNKKNQAYFDYGIDSELQVAVDPNAVHTGNYVMNQLWGDQGEGKIRKAAINSMGESIKDNLAKTNTPDTMTSEIDGQIGVYHKSKDGEYEPNAHTEELLDAKKEKEDKQSSIFEAMGNGITGIKDFFFGKPGDEGDDKPGFFNWMGQTFSNLFNSKPAKWIKGGITVALTGALFGNTLKFWDEKAKPAIDNWLGTTESGQTVAGILEGIGNKIDTVGMWLRSETPGGGLGAALNKGFDYLGDFMLGRDHFEGGGLPLALKEGSKYITVGLGYFIDKILPGTTAFLIGALPNLAKAIGSGVIKGIGTLWGKITGQDKEIDEHDKIMMDLSDSLNSTSMTNNLISGSDKIAKEMGINTSFKFPTASSLKGSSGGTFNITDPNQYNTGLKDHTNSELEGLSNYDKSGQSTSMLSEIDSALWRSGANPIGIKGVNTVGDALTTTGKAMQHVPGGGVLGKVGGFFTRGIGSGIKGLTGSFNNMSELLQGAASGTEIITDVAKQNNLISRVSSNVNEFFKNNKVISAFSEVLSNGLRISKEKALEKAPKLLTGLGDSITNQFKSIGSKLSSNALASASAKVLTSGWVWAVSDFISGLSNAIDYFEISQKEYDQLDDNARLIIAFGGAAAKTLSGLLLGLVPEVWLVNTVTDFLGQAGLDSASIKQAQNETASQIEEWNLTNPNDQFDSVAEFNDAMYAHYKSNQILNNTSTIPGTTTTVGEHYSNMEDGVMKDIYTSTFIDPALRARGTRRLSGGATKNINTIKFNNPNDTVRQTLGDSGCAPLSAVEMIKYMTDMNVPTEYAADYAISRGYKDRNGGVDINYFKDIFAQNNIASDVTTNSKLMDTALRNNKNMIILGETVKGRSGPFTNNPHYVAVNGNNIKSGKYGVYSSETNSVKYYDRNTLLKNAKGAVIVNGNTGLVGGFSGINNSISGFKEDTSIYINNIINTIHNNLSEFINNNEVSSTIVKYATIIGMDIGEDIVYDALKIGLEKLITEVRNNLIRMSASNLKKVALKTIPLGPFEIIQWVYDFIIGVSSTKDNFDLSNTEFKKLNTVDKFLKRVSSGLVAVFTGMLPLQIISDGFVIAIVMDIEKMIKNSGKVNKTSMSSIKSNKNSYISNIMSGGLSGRGFSMLVGDSNDPTTSTSWVDVAKGITTSSTSKTTKTQDTNSNSTNDIAAAMAAMNNTNTIQTEETTTEEKPNLFTMFTDLGSSMLNSIFGKDLVESFFGSSSSSTDTMSNVFDSGSSGATQSSINNSLSTSNKPANEWFMATLEGATKSANYGQQGNYWKAGHQGEDYAAPEGTKIYSPVSGIVNNITGEGEGQSTSYGNRVWIKDDYGFMHVFAHLRVKPTHIRVGDRIKQGDFIGEVGTSGNSSGNHLHYGVYHESDLSKAYNPNTYLYEYVNKANSNLSGAGKFINKKHTIKPIENKPRGGDDSSETYIKFLQIIVDALFKIVDNSGKIDSIITILNENLGLNVSSKDIQSGKVNKDALTKSAMNSIKSDPSLMPTVDMNSMLSKDTESILKMLASIASQ